MFNDETTFHLTGKFNARIWGIEHLHLTLEPVRDSPEVNVFCATLKKCVHGPFLVEGKTVNSKAYLAVLQDWLMGLLIEE